MGEKGRVTSFLTKKDEELGERIERSIKRNESLELISDDKESNKKLSNNTENKGKGKRFDYFQNKILPKRDQEKSKERRGKGDDKYDLKRKVLDFKKKKFNSISTSSKNTMMKSKDTKMDDEDINRIKELKKIDSQQEKKSVAKKPIFIPYENLKKGIEKEITFQKVDEKKSFEKKKFSKKKY
jgi:hypothetical protein